MSVCPRARSPARSPTVRSCSPASVWGGVFAAVLLHGPVAALERGWRAQHAPSPLLALGSRRVRSLALGSEAVLIVTTEGEAWAWRCPRSSVGWVQSEAGQLGQMGWTRLHLPASRPTAERGGTAEDEAAAGAPVCGMQRVALSGLSARPDLNGARGVTAGLDPQSGRWAVLLESGERVAVKPARLRLLETRPRAAEAEPEEVGGLVAAYGSEHMVLLCSQRPTAAAAALEAQAAESEDESACALR